MSKINTNTNNDHNRNSGRDGRGQGSPNGSGRSDCHTNCRNKLIAKYLFKGKMKDGPISKLTITETGRRPAQFKKIRNALPVFCADENYGGLNEVRCTGRDKVNNDSMPAYLDTNQWSTTHHIQVATVNPRGTTGINATTNEHPVIYNTM